MFLILLFVCSCTNTEPEVVNRKLVVEGWIENGEYPTVILTCSGVLDEEHTQVSDLVVRWGKVTLSDGDTTVTLIGGKDNRFFPAYSYRSYDMKGEPGKTYTLKAQYYGMEVEAVSTMPTEIPVIKKVDVSYIDTIADIKLQIASSSSPRRYYQLFSCVDGQDKRYYPAFLGAITNEKANDELLEATLYKGKSIQQKTFNSMFSVGHTVKYKVAQINEPEYNFWYDYQNLVNFNFSQFVTTSSKIQSNVKGGYGIWYAATVAKGEVVLDDKGGRRSEEGG